MLAIIFSFAHAFLILLRPNLKFASNNLEDGNNTTFSDYSNSLLATYLILTGNFE